MPDGPKISAETLEKDGFGEQQFFKCLVAELDSSVSSELATGAEMKSYSVFFNLKFLLVGWILTLLLYLFNLGRKAGWHDQDNNLISFDSFVLFCLLQNLIYYQGYE